ncbi:SpoIIE family protein phosphatase [Shewanella aestuarii]|uniref:SpoIIE family protein phosphatase n=1 Tax=Shewanella aestuarii TaxID=1028752 RepID=A0A6G9QKT4_9GAMM|nr:SpoIIE family protein phosphatase [Shewanella aestuarii]QIR14667.1 SpoIIE family protein phosphatase [Shewanella aestuarii]
MSVLIIEDSPVFGLMYKKFFKGKGISIVICQSLEKAKQEIENPQYNFELVLLDNHLPDGKGIEILSDLKSKLPLVAIIMVSANSETDFFVEAFKQGIDDIALKPIDMELLWLKMKKSFHQRYLEILNNNQREALNIWRDSQLQEQALAKHLIGAMHGKIHSDISAINYWVKPSSLFSGDSIIHCDGPDGSHYVMLADAMGHGLAATVSLMPMMQAFGAMADKGLPLCNIVFELNSKLNHLLTEDRFVAVVIIHLQLINKTIEVWNGGMPPVIIVDDQYKIIKQVKSANMALGVLSDNLISVSTEKLDLVDNQRLLLFSDGAIETPSIEGNMLSVDDLVSLVKSSEEPLEAVKLHFNDKCESPPDDISIVVIDTHDILQTLIKDDEVIYTQESAFIIEHTLQGKSMDLLDVPSHLCELLSKQLPLSLVSKVFTVLTELYLNAFEHGILELKSEIKSEENGFLNFYEQKQERTNHLSNTNKIKLKIQWQSNTQRLEIYIEDSGHGFFNKDIEPSALFKSYGRGLSLIENIADSLEIIPPGNATRVVLVGKI